MNYRRPFLILLSLNVVLIVAGFWLWKRGNEHPPAAPSAVETKAVPVATGEPAPQEAPLAPVQLTPERMQSIGVTLGTVREAELTNDIRATGTVAINERGLAYVQTRYSGWIRDVFANATYQYIRKGQPLFTIYAPDLVATEQEYLLALRNEQQLKNSSVNDVSSAATSLVSAARDRLRQWNIPEADIQKVEKSGKPISELTVVSSVSGYITDRSALPNMYVQPGTQLYTVANLSSVWVNAQVFQDDVGKLKPGDPAEITTDAYPGKVFHGRIEQILPQVDMTTRTVAVRLDILNPGLRLKPGMFVTVSLHAPMRRQLIVPASAVLMSGTRQIAFVARGNGLFEPREVTVGPEVGENYPVLKGLSAGEQVVTSANFLIDSEAQLQAAAGAFVPPPPGVGGTSRVAQPASSANIEFTTDPSPPRKGNNTVRVKLTDAKGAPITGAQVTVTFFMQAMPAMGMTAMKTDIATHESSPGLYEGSGELGSGGTWQATVTAQRNGQVLAQKQMSVSTEGGMQ
jgi:membrane fusion protein, copper/silver efflux system